MKEVSAAVNNRTSRIAGIISFFAILACIILLQFMFQPFGVTSGMAVPAMPVDMGRVMIQRNAPTAVPVDPLSVIPSRAGLFVSTMGNSFMFTPAAVLPSLQSQSVVHIRGYWELHHINEENGAMETAVFSGYTPVMETEEATLTPAAPLVLLKDSSDDK
ncbi:MAG: hypothetical protein J0I41_21045 [Filimonas sp.]|nr:hypothetical protein [Filimonas sp.]